jgi:DNA processing protein
VAEPGDPDAARLVRQFGAVDLLARLTASTPDSGRVQGWRQRVEALDLERLLASAESVQARYICPGDDEWPASLGDLGQLEDCAGDRRASAPIGLWVRGDREVAATTARAVSFVGARASTAYGEHVAGDLAGTCSVRGFTAVSGGAYGIDAAAHRGRWPVPGPPWPCSRAGSTGSTRRATPACCAPWLAGGWC